MKMKEKIYFLPELVNVPLEKLSEHPKNKDLFPTGNLDRIIQSIKDLGVIQPIVITPQKPFSDLSNYINLSAEEVLEKTEKFYICCGHRRVLAAKQIGYSTIPARIVIPLEPNIDILVLIHENITQRILSPDMVVKAIQTERSVVPTNFILETMPDLIKNFYKENLINDEFLRAIYFLPKSEIKKIETLLKKLANTGVNNISSLDEAKKFQEILQEKEQKIQELLKEKEKIKKEKEILLNVQERLNVKIEQTKKEKEKLTQKLSQLEQEKNTLKRIYSETKDKNIEKKIKDKEDQIKEIKDELDFYKETIKKLKDDLKREQTKFEALKERMNKIIEDEVQKRIKETEENFRNLLKETKKKFEKELKEKEKQIKKLRIKENTKNKTYSDKKPSETLLPAERQAILLIDSSQSFATKAFILFEIADTLFHAGKKQIVLETILALEELSKGLLGLTQEIRKKYNLK